MELNSPVVLYPLLFLPNHSKQEISTGEIARAGLWRVLNVKMRFSVGSEGRPWIPQLPPALRPERRRGAPQSAGSAGNAGMERAREWGSAGNQGHGASPGEPRSYIRTSERQPAFLPLARVQKYVVIIILSVLI